MDLSSPPDPVSGMKRNFRGPCPALSSIVRERTRPGPAGSGIRIGSSGTEYESMRGGNKKRIRNRELCPAEKSSDAGSGTASGGRKPDFCFQVRRGQSQNGRTREPEGLIRAVCKSDSRFLFRRAVWVYICGWSDDTSFFRDGQGEIRRASVKYCQTYTAAAARGKSTVCLNAANGTG